MLSIINKILFCYRVRLMNIHTYNILSPMGENARWEKIETGVLASVVLFVINTQFLFYTVFFLLKEPSLYQKKSAIKIINNKTCFHRTKGESRTTIFLGVDFSSCWAFFGTVMIDAHANHQFDDAIQSRRLIIWQMYVGVLPGWGRLGFVQ